MIGVWAEASETFADGCPKAVPATVLLGRFDTAQVGVQLTYDTLRVDGEVLAAYRDAEFDGWLIVRGEWQGRWASDLIFGTV